MSPETVFALYVAKTFPDVWEATVLVRIMKLIEVAPAGINTLGGRFTSVGRFELSDTLTPPAGAG